MDRPPPSPPHVASRVSPPAGESHVRLRPSRIGIESTFSDSSEVLAELWEEHLAVGDGLASLDAQLALPRSVATASLQSIRVEVGRPYEAAESALRQMVILSRPLVSSSSLVDYMRGLYAWLGAVARALEELTVSMRTDEPSWALYCLRVEEASFLHFDELHDTILQDLEVFAGSARSLRASMCHLFAHASAFDARLKSHLAK